MPPDFSEEVCKDNPKGETSDIIGAGYENIKREDKKKMVQSRSKPKQRKSALDTNGIAKGYLYFFQLYNLY